MLKIIYEFLCRLHLSMRNIGKDQGSFLLFWEVNLFSEKMASQTQYSLVRWWQCSPKISDITRKCECLLIFFSFPEINMLRHDPPLVSLRQIVKIHKYKKLLILSQAWWLTFSQGCSGILMSSTSLLGKRGGVFSYPNLQVISWDCAK